MNRDTFFQEERERIGIRARGTPGREVNVDGDDEVRRRREGGPSAGCLGHINMTFVILVENL